MSGPRLKWPRLLADVLDFPPELVAALAAVKVVTIGDVVARVKQLNPGLIPPVTAIGVNLWRAAPGSLTDDNRKLALRAGDALARFLGYREHERPIEWTDPPTPLAKPNPHPNTEDHVPTIKQLPTASLTLHPEAALVPEMPADMYAVFLADVKERGVVTPIELVPGTKTVIEGRTRLKAATEAGLASVPVVDADLRGDPPVVYMIRAAFLRRHLTGGQRATLGAELEEQIAKAVKERKREARKAAKEASGDGKPKVEQISTIPTAAAKGPQLSKSREQAGKEAGVSGKYVSEAKRVKKQDPALYERLKAGTVSLPEAVRIVRSDFTKPPAKSEPEPAPKSEQKEPPPAKAAIDICATLHALNPCPFCGAEGSHLATLGGHGITCHNCGAMGPNKKDENAARAAWNKRAKK